MIRLIFILVGLSIATSSIRGQCPELGLYLETQTDVDSFPLLYPDCVRPNFIWLAASEFILDDQIVDLQPLAQLEYVDGNMFVAFNERLTSLQGLDNIDSIAGQLSIGSNNLADLDGLSGLRYVADDLSITEWSLGDISGLSSLEYAGTFALVAGDGVTDLTGLEGLSYCKELTIWNSQVLSLDGLSPSIEIDSSVRIIANPLLEDISALPSMASLDTLTIIENAALEICHVDLVCDFLTSSTAATIADNAVGCDSVHVIINQCRLVDVDDQQHFTSASIYPTLAYDLVTVDLGLDYRGHYSVVAHATGGQVMIQLYDGAPMQIDVSHLPAGQYYIVVDHSSWQPLRFVKLK